MGGYNSPSAQLNLAAWNNTGHGAWGRGVTSGEGTLK